MEFIVILKVNGLYVENEDDFIEYLVESNDKNSAIDKAFLLCENEIGPDYTVFLENVKV